MNLKEYLETIPKNDRVTFIISKAVKDSGSPFYHNEFETVPIRIAWEWLQSTHLDKYLVINSNHPPIDITGGWVNWYNRNDLRCLIVTTKESLITQYGEKQGSSMIEYYKKHVRL